MKNIKAIILAAGEGKRMKSQKPKVLHEIFNKPMIEYVLDAAEGSGIQEICMVVGHQAEEVKKAITKADVSFVLQKEQLGTGHAVMQAQHFIPAEGEVLILCGDTPLVTAETLQKFLQFHQDENNDVSILSAWVDNPAGYGHIIRDKEGSFLKNIEHKDANAEEKLVCEINTGIYCFQGKKLKEALTRLTNHNQQGEYYLPDTLEIIRKDGGKVNAMIAEDAHEFLGVNSRIQLAEATDVMKKRINLKWMEEGVTLVDPQNTYIGPEVSIGQDTVVLPGCVLEGKTVIGEGCIIGPNSRMTNMILSNGVKFQASTGMDSTIGEETTVGPYAYIRPNCVIGAHVKVGDFVEVKNSVIGNGTKISHLTYIGDTDAGENINFGCGTVTVNYDGKKKFRTTIEDGAFIGCNANLVAPVTVKKGSYIAAGSTVTKDVPEDALAVARSRQQNIEGWTKKH